MVLGQSPQRSDECHHRIDRRQFLTATAGVATAATAGCLGQFGGDGSADSGGGTPGWKTYRGDRQRTGHVPAEEGPGESLSVAWETSAFDLAEHQHDVTAVGAWEADQNPDAYAGQVQCSPATLTDDLLLCTMHYRLHTENDSLHWGGVVALDPATGSFEWTIQGTPSPIVPPTVIEGRLYLPVVLWPGSGSQPAHLLVADASTGEVQRRQEIAGLGEESFGRMAPTITSDAAYFTPWLGVEWDGLAADPATGEHDWTTDAGGVAADYAFTPTDDVVLYSASRDDSPTEVVALDATSGEEQWRSNPEFQESPHGYHEFLGPPTVVGDRGYVAGRWRGIGDNAGAGLHSFDADSGDERWQFRPEGVPMASLSSSYDRAVCEATGDCPDGGYGAVRGVPLVVDGLVIVAGFGQPAEGSESHEQNYHVYAVDDDDGSLQWSIPGMAVAPVAAGDVIYVRFVDDAVTAVSTDGSVLATVESGQPASISRSPSVGHGRVYTQWGPGDSTPGPAPASMVAIE